MCFSGNLLTGKNNPGLEERFNELEGQTEGKSVSRAMVTSRSPQNWESTQSRRPR